ncbi:hypothetical protein, partial [Pedobacter sandarakinus]|uniref:hypothetical protein n=1 Tax=Pedobacter sandarakinus TaxID=353156 RepID=UPI002247D496
QSIAGVTNLNPNGAEILFVALKKPRHFRAWAVSFLMPLTKRLQRMRDCYNKSTTATDFLML